MTLISETVNQYYFGATKVIKTVEEDDNSFLVETKKVYFLGLKVFQSSTCRKRSIRDSVMQAAQVTWFSDLTHPRCLTTPPAPGNATYRHNPGAHVTDTTSSSASNSPSPSRRGWARACCSSQHWRHRLRLRLFGKPYQHLLSSPLTKWLDS